MAPSRRSRRSTEYCFIPLGSHKPNCSATRSNVDGVLAFPTKGGCGAHYGSSDLGQLQRTMAGIVDHPNVAAYLILSLGCEVNQPDHRWLAVLGEVT